MFALRTHRREARESLWLAIMAIVAAAIILTMAVKLAGAAEPRPPRFLPTLTNEWEGAVNHFREGKFIEARQRLQNVMYRLAPGTSIESPADRGLSLWNILTAQACGQYEQAMREWAGVDLPEEMRAWKHVAIAAMHLERAENDQAAVELAMAQLLGPENPVVHYYLGVLHIQLADEAFDWPDDIRDWNVRRVALNPNVVSNTKAMYQLAAIRDLEYSIEAAACFDPSIALIPEDWTTEPTLRPTGSDILRALRATDFAPNAHQMLAYLFLERGALEVAEEHADRAKELGANVPFIFNNIGEMHEAEGRHADAARAYLKAVGSGPDRAGALMRFFRNMGDSVHD